MRVLLVLLFAGVSLTADGVSPKAFGDDAKPADSSPHPVSVSYTHLTLPTILLV